MDGGVVLPISVKDDASAKLDKIAKNAKKMEDAFAKGDFGGYIKDGILGQMKNLAKGSIWKSAAIGVGTTIAKGLGDGISKAFDISNEMTAMMGKLRMALDPGTSVNENLAKIEQQAQKSRVPMETLTEAVANLGLTSGKYFTNDELIAFTGSLSTYASLVGATTQQIESAQYQLTQAFSKGKMAMDDFKPLMNALPGIANELAKALGVSVAELQEMVSAGKVTTDQIKKAFIGMGETVQAKLAKMPMTLEQRMYGIQNAIFAAKKAVGEFVKALGESYVGQVILGGIELTIKRLVNIFNKLTKAINKAFGKKSENSVESLEKAIETFSNVLLAVIIAIIVVVGILIVHFVILGIQGLISGLIAGAGWAWLILIFLAIIAIIVIVILVVQALGLNFQQVGEFVGGCIGAVIAFIWNLFLGLLDLVLEIINIFGRKWQMFANFFGNIFKDPIASIIYMMRDMANSVLSIVKAIANALDKVFGSHLADGVQGWMDGVDKLADKAAKKLGNGSYEGTEWEDISSETLGLARMDYSDAWNKGSQIGGQIGAGIDDALSGLGDLWGQDQLGIGDELSDYDASTGKGSLSTKLDDDSVDELKAFAEIQYRLNYKHITPNVNIKFGDVRETADIQDITRYIKKMMNEDLEELYITEGGQ